jgi:hypothetical protein
VSSNPTLSASFKLLKITKPSEMNDWRVGGTSTYWAVKWFNYKDLAFFTIARHSQLFVSQAFSIDYGL